MSETPRTHENLEKHDPDAVLLLEQFNADLTEDDLRRILDTTGTADIADAAAQKTLNSAVQSEIAELHSKYGSSFAAYLTLPDVDLDCPGLEGRFQNSFQGSFTSREQVAQMHIQALGWQDLLDRLVRIETLPLALMRWDYDALLELIEEGWDLVQLSDDSIIHQFAQ